MIDAEHILHRQQTRGEAYLLALQDPLSTLLRPEQRYKPLVTSSVRGVMVLSKIPDVDNHPVTVIANTHALTGANSAAYIDRQHAPEIRDIMDVDRMAYALRMGVYTRDGDTLVVESNRPKETYEAYQAMRATFEHIGIQLTSDIQIVDSVGHHVAYLQGQRPILATFIEPSYLATFGDTHEEATALFHEGLRNVAAYTKNGAEQLWRHNSIPTPPTRYFDLAEQSVAAISSEIRESLGGYDSYVVNTYDGAGGDGIHIISSENLESELPVFGSREIQVQGKLPLLESPCVIANVTDEGINVQMVSRQRVVNGAHAGNEWVHEAIDDHEFPEEFWGINGKALECLRRAGIRGQVNVDSLIISKETQRQYQLPTQVLMREANIRPAASSVILRMRQGNILGRSITRIHTHASIPLSFADFVQPAFQELLQRRKEEGMVAVAFNFDLHDADPTHQKVALAFCGTEGISSEDLHAFEMEIRQAIQERSYTFSSANSLRRKV